jgi:hypothetical protein
MGEHTPNCPATLENYIYYYVEISQKNLYLWYIIYRWIRQKKRGAIKEGIGMGRSERRDGRSLKIK